MWRRSSDTGNPEIKNKYSIYVLPDLLVFFFHNKIQKENIMIVPKQISISDKSMLFDGSPTAKLGKW